MNRQRRRTGFTLLELITVLAVAAIMALVAVPNLSRVLANQRLKDAARDVAGAFALARAEAMRSGNEHLVYFGPGGAQTVTNQDLRYPFPGGPLVPVLVLSDANGNCSIDPGESLRGVSTWNGIGFGRNLSSSRAPNDASAGDPSNGVTFVDGAGNDVTWVLFRPDGTPVTVTTGCVEADLGSGNGAVYLTNGDRDLAIVLLPLGTNRVLSFDRATGSWK